MVSPEFSTFLPFAQADPVHAVESAVVREAPIMSREMASKARMICSPKKLVDLRTPSTFSFNFDVHSAEQS
jgi:hypothetical protein